MFLPSVQLCDFLALNHVPQIHRILQNMLHCLCLPRAVFRKPLGKHNALQISVVIGIGNLFGSQRPCNRGVAHPIPFHPKNTLYHLRRLWIDGQLMPVLRELHIAIGGKIADKLAAAFLGVQRRIHLLRNVLGVNVVHQVFQRDGHGLSAVRPDTVVVIIDGDKPHSHEGQYLFQKVSGFQEVAPKPGQVFHDDAVHPACFHILHHPLESRALKICPGFSVVTIAVVQLQIRVLGDIFAQIVDLRLQALAVLAVTGVHDGEAHIKGCAENP